ncbi:MAG: formylmethanofuran dehydrogenase subunit B [Planctomycetia bacterium]|nr:formylmethanofuran dehydrogenase subunit B [Planctomycetia bacterium]
MADFEHVACTVCGCVCDDLRLTVQDGRIVRAEGACPLAEPWLLGQDGCQPAVAEVAGQPAPLPDALAQAAILLRAARSPLIYGLARSSTAGQRAAVALAESTGATIDTNASLCHAPSIRALQEVGEVTCTLGEVKNRADLVVFWGANPVASHPRHLERYSLDARGRHVPAGRSNRFLVVADTQPTATSQRADLFIPIEPNRDFEALATLRCLVRGAPLHPTALGAPLPLLRELAERMQRCRYGIIFFGLGLSMTGAGPHNVEALLQLVTDLNAHTRFCARRLRMQGNVAGADTVLLWQTGFPFSVNLARGYPRYNPGEFSAQDLLERGDVDACLFVGSEGAADFSEAALAHLRRIPVITLDHPTVPSLVPPTIRFTTAVPGVHHTGTAYRMDVVPIPLRAVLPANYPTDEAVLQGIELQLAG